MSEQDGKHTSTKRRRNRETSKQNSTQVSTLQRPANDDKEAWKAYWIAQGQPWRTEPEFDAERQKYLTERRTIVPNIEQGIYPFKDIKLSRADVEWLLATHENGRGPVDHHEINLSKRDRLDLRGADLSRMNLSKLPLAFLNGGLSDRERVNATIDQCERAAILLKGADLSWAHLELAYLNFAHLERANLSYTHLEQAHLRWAHLEYANLNFVHLESAHLRGAYLSRVNLSEAYLERIRLENAIISDDKQIGPQLADTHWSDVNLAVVKWSQVEMLGDEYEACQLKRDGVVKEKITRLGDYEKAVRANRQLAVALQTQGLNEEAARFAYRAQAMQRKVLWQQRDFGHWLFSMLLAILSGYGYRIWRILAAYILLVSLFALAYFVLGMYYTPHLHLDQAYLESITAFHGRVFLEQFNTNTPQIWLTAFEAITGLVVEGVFIAMLIQRFFGK